MRIIRFSQHKSLNLCFMEKTRNNFKRGLFFLFLQKNYILTIFVSWGQKKTYFLYLWFLGREEPKYLYLVFQERILTERILTKRFFTQREKKIIKINIYFSQWQFLGSYKTPRNCSPIFSFIWVGSGHPTQAPKPNSNISHLHKMG